MGSVTSMLGPRPYLDANIFIYAVDGVPEVKTRLVNLFSAIEKGDLVAVTSELSLAEALVRPLREQDNRACKEFEALLSGDGLIQIPSVTRAILLKAARFRAAHTPLKLPDAIHAATAISCGCSCLLTHDARFRNTPGLRVVLLNEFMS